MDSGGGECFLERFFREVKRSGDTNERGNDPAVLFTKNFFESFARLGHAGERKSVSRKGAKKDAKAQAEVLLWGLCVLLGELCVKLS